MKTVFWLFFWLKMKCSIKGCKEQITLNKQTEDARNSMLMNVMYRRKYAVQLFCFLSLTFSFCIGSYNSCFEKCYTNKMLHKLSLLPHKQVMNVLMYHTAVKRWMLYWNSWKLIRLLLKPQRQRFRRGIPESWYCQSAVVVNGTSYQLFWRSTSCHRSHMGRAARHSGGTWCGSSELPEWCRSCHRRDTSPDSLGVKEKNTSND